MEKKQTGYPKKKKQWLGDDIIAKLVLRRKVLDMPQYKLSKKAGVSIGLVNLFESKRTNISFGKLDKIAGALGMKVVIDVVEDKN